MSNLRRADGQLFNNEQKRLIVTMFATYYNAKEIADALEERYPGIKALLTRETGEFKYSSLNRYNPGTILGRNSISKELMEIYIRAREECDKELATVPISNRMARQLRRNEHWHKVQEVIEERAQMYADHDFTPARTGLMVRREIPIGDGETREEFTLDASALKALNELEDAAMEEAGHKKGISVSFAPKLLVGVNIGDI